MKLPAVGLTRGKLITALSLCVGNEIYTPAGLIAVSPQDTDTVPTIILAVVGIFNEFYPGISPWRVLPWLLVLGPA